MKDLTNIPTIDPDTFLSTYTHTGLAFSFFYANKENAIGDLIGLVPLSRVTEAVRFPLPLHRQTQYSAIFVFQGEIEMTSGVDTYQLGKGGHYVGNDDYSMNRTFAKVLMFILCYEHNWRIVLPVLVIESDQLYLHQSGPSLC